MSEWQETEIGAIPANWQVKSLKALVAFTVDNRGKTAPTEDKGIPLIATNCVDNDHLYPLHEDIRYVSQETYDNWFRSHPEPGDILLTLKGSQNGAVCLVPNPVDFVIAQDMVALRADENVTDPLFLFAALRSRIAQHQIKALDVSGVIPHFKKSDFDKLILPYPDRITQKEIGKLYFNLCAKIDLLRRQNTTLETIAQTLFTRWFVDFEFPNAQGRPYESAGGPMQASELGEIPAGWRVGTLGEVITINKDSVTREYEHKFIEYVDISSVSKGKLDSTTRYELKEAPSRARRLVSHGDTIWSCVRPNRESYYFVANPKDNLVVSTGFAVLSPISVPPSFLYSITTTETFVRYLTASADGSAYPAVRPDRFADAAIIIPSQQSLDRFAEIAEPMRTKIAQNDNQIRTLTTLRDTLLPKLMSGKVRVAAGA